MEQRSFRDREQSAANVADIYVRGALRIADMQASAARVLLQTQARTARMFGAPDWSNAFNGPGEQLSQWFNTGTEQALSLMRQTNETISEVNQQLSRIVQRQTVQLAEEMRQGLEAVNRRAQDSLHELRETTEQAASEAARGAGRAPGREEAHETGGGARRSRQSR